MKAKDWIKDKQHTEHHNNLEDVLELMEQYANEKVKEAVKEIQSQATDGPLRGNWIGFKAYL